ncbi:MAG: putative HNHc nuclease [Weissella confusa]
MMDIWGRITSVHGNKVTMSVESAQELASMSLYTTEDQPQAVITIADERQLSKIQRKKAYAIMNDIANWTGYAPEEVKDLMKSYWVAETGEPYFSFKDTDMTTAREFISFLLEFILKNHIPLRKSGLELNDDLDRYMEMSVMHRSCVICGQRAQIHHVDTIGMGNDRTETDHREHRLIALCAIHHKEAHDIGWATFASKYHVKGVYLRGDQLVRLGMMSKRQVQEFDEKYREAKDD